MTFTCKECGKPVRQSGGTRYVLDWCHVKSSPHRAVPLQMGNPEKLLKAEMIEWIYTLQAAVSESHRSDADRIHRERVWDDYH